MSLHQVQGITRCHQGYSDWSHGRPSTVGAWTTRPSVALAGTQEDVCHHREPEQWWTVQQNTWEYPITHLHSRTTVQHAQCRTKKKQSPEVYENHILPHVNRNVKRLGTLGMCRRGDYTGMIEDSTYRGILHTTNTACSYWLLLLGHQNNIIGMFRHRVAWIWQTSS